MADGVTTNYDYLKHKEEALEMLKERIGPSVGTPLNVAVIGAPGVGKSCFINTMITSMVGEYREWSKTGDSGGYGKRVTSRLTMIPRETYVTVASEETRQYNFPNFLDMAGIEDFNDELTKELLVLIIFGRIPLNVSLAKVAKDIRKYDRWYIDKRYPATPEVAMHKIDRIIFVASAANPVLPNRLMNAISTVLWRKRDIPIFGVLTNEDRKKNSGDFEELEKNFRCSLQLSKLHYFVCTTYCDDNIDEIKRGEAKCKPHLDLPVLKFLLQVLDPVLQSVDFESGNESIFQKIKKRFYKKPDKNENSTWFYIMIPILVFLVAMIIMLLFQK